MKSAARFAGSVVYTAMGVAIGLIAGIIVGGSLGVGIAMIFHVL
jgi:hypothetical protein